MYFHKSPSKRPIFHEKLSLWLSMFGPCLKVRELFRHAVSGLTQRSGAWVQSAEKLDTSISGTG